jgi:hypothetical protein
VVVLIQRSSVGDYVDAANPGAGLVPVVGSGQDCWAAFQALVDAVAALDPNNKGGPNLPIQLARGNYWLSRTLDYKTYGQLVLWGSKGTQVSGSFAGPLVGRNLTGLNQSGSADVRDIVFYNANAAGTCLQLEYVNDSLLDRCSFKGYRGLLVGGTWTPGSGNNLDVVLRDCRADGDLTGLPGCVGFDLHGGVFHGYGLRAFNCSVGIRGSGDVNLFGGHEEDCGVGLQFGADGAGADRTTEARFHGWSTEACTDTHVQIRKACHYTEGDIQVVGDPQGGVNWPNFGIDVQDGAGKVLVKASNVSGSFVNSAIHLGAVSGACIFLVTDAFNAGLAPGGSTTAWDTASAGSSFLPTGCNN